jgi:hypothetical protein
MLKGSQLVQDVLLDGRRDDIYFADRLLGVPHAVFIGPGTIHAAVTSDTRLANPDQQFVEGRQRTLLHAQCTQALLDLSQLEG